MSAGRADHFAADVVTPLTPGWSEALSGVYARMIAEHVTDAIVITDTEGRVEWVNPSFTTLTGFTLTEAAGKVPGDMLQGDGTDRAEARRIGQHLRDRRPIRSEILNYTKSGAPYWVELDISPVFDQAGQHTHFISVERDITERRTMQDEMSQALEGDQRQRNERRLLFETTEWLYTAKSQEELLDVISTCMGYLIPEAGGHLFLYRHSRDALVFACGWGDMPVIEHMDPSDCWSLRKGRAYSYGVNEIDFPCAHVTERDDLGPYLCLPITANGEAIGLMHLRFGRGPWKGTDRQTLQDILVRRRELALICAEQISLALANVQLRDQLHDQSVRDQLTGLMNRRWFMETFRKEVARATIKAAPVSLISLDIDHFKLFNDNHGHDAGDTVLREVGRLLSDHFADWGFPCRTGGEEFIVLAPGQGADAAYEKAESFRASMADAGVRYLGTALPNVTISAGVAGFPDHGGDPQAVLRKADAGLYAAKRAGRNRVHLTEDPPLARDETA